MLCLMFSGTASIILGSSFRIPGDVGVLHSGGVDWLTGTWVNIVVAEVGVMQPD